MNLAQNHRFSSFTTTFFTRQTHEQKQLKKGKKMFYTHATPGCKHTGKPPGFPHITQYYDNIQKSLDFCDFLI